MMAIVGLKRTILDGLSNPVQLITILTFTVELSIFVCNVCRF